MKVLLIAPKFYDYSKLMASYLVDKNCEVTLISDTISLNTIERVIKRLNNKYPKKKFDKYFARELYKHKSVSFDRVVLIFGDRYFSKDNILLIKKYFPTSKTIFYSWDTVENYPNILEYYNFFDKSYSFDKSDCLKYNMTFRPLFYSDCHTNDKFSQVTYDVSGLMSYGYKKKNSTKLILSKIPNGLNKKFYFYMPNKYIYFFNKIKYKDAFDFIDRNYFKFRNLNLYEGIRFFSDSSVVIDCPLDKQQGLTIRIFEVLSLNKKVITTNKDIKNYDFYSKDNIFIVDEDTPYIPIDFFKRPFNKKFSISNYYSLDTFMRTIFELD